MGMRLALPRTSKKYFDGKRKGGRGGKTNQGIGFFVGGGGGGGEQSKKRRYKK